MDWLLPLLMKFDDPIVIVLLLGNIGIGWLFLTERRENRTDRQAMLEVINRNSEALNSMRSVLSASLGKPVL